jgi:hypothetical protein
MEYVRQRSPIPRPMGYIDRNDGERLTLDKLSVRTQFVVRMRSHTKEGKHMLAITENINAASTSDRLLEIGTRHAGDPLLHPVTLHRWESDGGAVPPPRSQAQMQDA